jgi:hypothetical protein
VCVCVCCVYYVSVLCVLCVLCIVCVVCMCVCVCVSGMCVWCVCWQLTRRMEEATYNSLSRKVPSSVSKGLLCIASSSTLQTCVSLCLCLCRVYECVCMYVCVCMFDACACTYVCVRLLAFSNI